MWRHRPDSASLYHQSTLRTHPYTIPGPPPGASVTTTRIRSDHHPDQQWLAPGHPWLPSPPATIEHPIYYTPRNYKRSPDILPRTHTHPYV